MKVKAMLLFVTVLSCGLECMEAPDTGADEQPGQEEAKRKLSTEEQITVNQELVDAVKDGMLDLVKKAIDAGAQVTSYIFDDEEGKDVSILYYAFNKPDAKIITFLLEQGAPISHHTMEQAARLAGLDTLKILMLYGGYYNDADVQDEILEAVNQEFFFDVQMNLPRHARDDPSAQASLFYEWILLRNQLDEEQRSYLQRILLNPYSFMTEDYQVVSLQDRLGPIVLASIFSVKSAEKDTSEKDSDESAVQDTSVEDEIENLSKKFRISDVQKLSITNALIFSAAQNYNDILALILTELRKYLTSQDIRKALEATVLRGHLSPFKALLESGFFVGLDLTNILEDMLLLAATQRHEDIVTYIIDLDRQEQLNVNVLPVAQRLDTILMTEEGETKDMYSHLSDLLGNYLAQRNIHQLIPESSTQRSPADIIIVPSRASAHEEEPTLRVIPCGCLLSLCGLF